MFEPQSIPPEILKEKRAINLYMIAVIALAAIGVLSVLGGILLAWSGKDVPSELWTFAGIAITGLVAMVSRDDRASV
jgi:hypothetical protein